MVRQGCCRVAKQVTPSSSVATNAQDIYRLMLKDHVGPFLRERGWRGSQGTYADPDSDYWVQVGFQRSQWNTADHVKFTLNLSVMSKAMWSEAREERSDFPAVPSANGDWGRRGWFERIGSVMHGGDFWWAIDSGDDPVALAGEVTEALDRFGLPAIERAKVRLRGDRLSPREVADAVRLTGRRAKSVVLGAGRLLISRRT